MRPDERNISSFFKHLLEGKIFPGIKLNEMSFEELLKKEKCEEMFILDKEGIDITKYTHGHLIQGSVFVLGDDVGLSNDYGLKKISIGPNSYLASHCISFLNMYLDGLYD